MVGDVDRPVDFARLLIAHGVPLPEAHNILNRVASGESVPLELRTGDARGLISGLAGLGVEAHLVAPLMVDVQEVRRRLGLSQIAFADRFGFEVHAIRGWEQGTNKPDSATQLLLKVIEEKPDVVDRALRLLREGSTQAGE